MRYNGYKSAMSLIVASERVGNRNWMDIAAVSVD